MLFPSGSNQTLRAHVRISGTKMEPFMDGGLKLATRFSNIETCCAAIFSVQIVFIFRRRKPQATNVAPISRPGGFSPPHDRHQSMHEAHSLRYFVGCQPAQRRHGEQKQPSESKFDHKSHKTLRTFSLACGWGFSRGRHSAGEEHSQISQMGCFAPVSRRVEGFRDFPEAGDRMSLWSVTPEREIRLQTDREQSVSACP